MGRYRTLLSKVGPIIIVMILAVSSITAVTGIPNFAENMKAVDVGLYSDVMKQVGNGNPIASGASYGGFVILWFAAFLAEVGANNKLKTVNCGMLISSFFIFGAASICCIALIGHINTVASADIPALILANQISPYIAQAFAVIICAGIYTSAVFDKYNEDVWKAISEQTPFHKLTYKFDSKNQRRDNTYYEKIMIGE